MSLPYHPHHYALLTTRIGYVDGKDEAKIELTNVQVCQTSELIKQTRRML